MLGMAQVGAADDYDTSILCWCKLDEMSGTTAVNFNLTTEGRLDSKVPEDIWKFTLSNM
jgi:hypothetical protein